MSSARLTVLVGTTKGAFLISGGSDRSGWTIHGPYCDGWPINHVIGDPETGTLWAGGGGPFHGAGVWRSDDGGKSWKVTRLTQGQMDDFAANDPNFAKMIGWTGEPLPFTDTFAQIWSLCYAHGTLYAGTKPAKLLASTNGGKDWQPVDALTDHPSAAQLEPGWGRARAAHHRVRSRQSEEALGWHLGGRRVRDRGRRRHLGAPQSPVERRSMRAPRPSGGTTKW